MLLGSQGNSSYLARVGSKLPMFVKGLKYFGNSPAIISLLLPREFLLEEALKCALQIWGCIDLRIWIILSTTVLPEPCRTLFRREAENGMIWTIHWTVQAVCYKFTITFGKITETYTLHVVHPFIFFIFPAWGPLRIIYMFVSSSQERASKNIGRTLFKINI